MPRVGAVDCGTNSIRLLVADVDVATGELTDVLRRMEVVRLGYGVDRTGSIDPQAMARTLAMASTYAGQCRELGDLPEIEGVSAGGMPTRVKCLHVLVAHSLAAAYAAAHEHYLARRAALGSVPESEGISAGGMPTRVKCLHVLVAHSLAVGPGVNPLGDEALAMLGEWWADGSCVPDQPAADA